MDPKDRELLERVAALSKKNNKILKKMQSFMRWQRFLSILYWVAIIGVAVGAYYWIQPILDPVIAAYHNFINSVSTLTSLSGH